MGYLGTMTNRTHNRTPATVAAWAALCGATVGACLALAVLAAPAPVTPSLPPCPTEDSVGCYWDASTMGNGTGRSYTVQPDGTVDYWDQGVFTPHADISNGLGSIAPDIVPLDTGV